MAKTTLAAWVCGCSLAAICAVPGAAQDNGQASVQTPSLPDAKTTNLEDIVVTANRRATNVQNTPLSITAVSGEKLANLGVQDTVALQQVTPGLTFNLNGAFAQPYIRGVGTDITSVGSESSVATFVDDVYQPFPAVGVQVLAGVDRIEVLKGPQGTLYGRNATGGAINVQTRNPNDSFQGDGDVSYGNYNAVQVHGYVTGPLADGLAANVAIAVSHRDGFGKDLATGSDYNRENYQYIRAKLRWDATNTLQFILSGYYFHRDDDAGMAYTYLNDRGAKPLPIALGGKVTIYSRDTYTAYPIGIRTNDLGGNLRTKWELGRGSLNSITSFERMNVFYGPDFISTNIPIFNFDARDNVGRNFSEELYYESSIGRLEYLVGGNYTISSNSFDPIRVYSGSAAVLDQFLHVDTRALSGYAEGKVGLTDHISVTGGVRYSSERKTQGRLDFITPSGVVVLRAGGAKKTWNNVSFKALAQYEIDNGMLYAKFESGFKSGSVVASVPGDFVEPETIKSYEAGLKTELLDRTVRFNVAAFYYEYKNLQVQYTDLNTGTALIQSADSARVKGAEVQLTWAPTKSFTVDAGLTYLSTKYTKFITNGVFVPSPAGGNVSTIANLSGKELVRAAPITGTISATYVMPLSNKGSLDFNGNIYYSGRYYFDTTNRIKQPAYTTISGQIRYTFPGNHLSIAIYARNLLDKNYLAISTPISFGDQAQLAPPRTFGVRLAGQF